jgi:hypothetical protein
LARLERTSGESTYVVGIEGLQDLGQQGAVGHATRVVYRVQDGLYTGREIHTEAADGGLVMVRLTEVPIRNP